MLHSDRELFRHILDEINFIEESKNISEELFLKDETLKRAFARSLEIIGEAVKQLSSEVIVANKNIPWRNIAGMRDKLIHGYFSVNYSLVWDVVINELPKLKKQVTDILENL